MEYADDVTIFICGQFPVVLKGLMDRMLNWAINNDLKMSPSKTELFLFTRNCIDLLP